LTNPRIPPIPGDAELAVAAVLDYMWAIPLLLAPIGIVIAIGLFVAALGSAANVSENPRQHSSDGSNLAMMMGESPRSSTSTESSSPSQPNDRYARWTITPRQITIILRLNIVASVMVIVATVVNISETLRADPSTFWLFSQEGVAAFHAIPALLVGGLMWLAWHMHKAMGTPSARYRFARLERVQRVVGIASSVWILALIGPASQGTLGGNPLIVSAALAPSVTGIIAMSVTLNLRAKIESDATKGERETDGK
jgi:hypothetical protein